MKFKHWLKLKLLNFYGPFVGAGIRIEDVSDNWREVKTTMRMRWYNRNIIGTHFGGSLYAMVDPQYMLMLMKRLGKDYIVWDKSAHIDFIRPGRGTVSATFRLSDEDIESIKKHTSTGEAHFPCFYVDVVDEKGDVVAHVKKEIYVRLKQRHR